MASSHEQHGIIRTPGGASSKHVTFASAHTSISIPAEEFNISPQKVHITRAALRARKATPYKKVASSDDNYAVEWTPLRNRRGHGTTKPRLVESGAVRVQIAANTNPRRGTNRDSQRLIDQGAVRVNVTRHTTPRRLYAKAQSTMWSPPPSKKKAPQSEKMPTYRRRPVGIASTTPTPSKKRSNAFRGGHKFRASLSPKPTASELHKENGDNCLMLEQSLTRKLFE